MRPASDSQCKEFQHLENLKVGERLKYKGGPQKNPKKDEVVIVYRVLESGKENKQETEGAQKFRFDFSTILEHSDGDVNYLLEYFQDSRYYERVEN